MRRTLICLLLMVLCSQQFLDQQGESQAPGEMVMQQIDMYAFLIICPICFLCIFTITIIYFKYPQTRRIPNDIMLVLSISDMFLLGQWFSCSLYYFLFDRKKSVIVGTDFDTFCNVQAFFGIVGSGGEFIYNCIFCFFLLIQIRIGIRRNSSHLKAVVYHGIAASLLIGMAIVVYATGSQGLNTYGTCSFKESLLFAYTGIAFVIFYLLLGSYTLYCFRKQIPDDPAFRKYREKFLNYYTQYIRWTVIIWAVLSVSRVVVTINMQLKTPIDTLFIFVTIDNIAKLAAPVVLTIIRYRNPSIKPVIDRFFRKSLCCCCKFKPKWVAQDDKQIALVEHSGSSCSELELNWFGELTSSIRLSQLYTILVGLNNNLMHRIAQKNVSHRAEVNNFDLNTEKKSESIGSADINPEHHHPKATIIPMHMSIYCQSIFEKFMHQDGFSLQQLRESLDPCQSLSLINQSASDGGKSGEFFLFTHDNRILIKTVTDVQLKVYLKRISQFAKHYEKHPDSLVTKFYGLFTFDWLEFSGPLIHLLITKNITQVGKDQLAAIYDLKGSRHNRQVLKLRRTMSLKVLKDIDFENIEGKMHAKPEELIELRSILINDSSFLKDIELIDYSLIIAKVDLQQKEPAPQKGQYRSTIQLGIYYRVGIVDYLQLWTHLKKFEKAAKKLINASPQLDTSAQDPVTYSNRFIALIERILVP